MPSTIKVLLLAADPGEGMARLRIDREIRRALDAALVFSAHFYAALSHGRSIPFAFDLASRVMDALQRPGGALPHLLVRPGVARWRVSRNTMRARQLMHVITRTTSSRMWACRSPRG